MRIQKCYLWYCIATWSVWSISILLAIVTGGGYHIQNMSVYQFALSVSRISLISTLIPIHPILFVLSLCSAIKHKRNHHITFNICSILFTSFLAFLVLVYYAYMIAA